MFCLFDDEFSSTRLETELPNNRDFKSLNA
jgi:hypothetical protein